MCIAGVCAAQAACCCASSACTLCCSCCPASVSSVMTRLMYLFFIVLGVLTSSIFLIPEVKEAMSKSTGIPFMDYSACSVLGLGKECEQAVGYESVYRVWFAFVMFFLLMTLLTVGVKSSNDCRAGLHNGFWFFKVLILIGIMVGAFYIPEDPFTKVWLYIGMVGGVLFIFVQVLYLIEFAHHTTESIQDAADESNGYTCVMVFGCFLMYGLALAGVIGMYIQFTTKDACNINKGLISVNLIMCIVVSVMSVLPGVKAANRRNGILQASVVSMYVTYLTFSALSAEPIGTGAANCPRNLTTVKGGGVAMLVTGVVIAILTVLYVSFKTKDGSAIAEDSESGGQTVADDETESTQYDYWMFHLMCLLCSLYCMMVMTNWFEPESVKNGFKFTASWPSMWIQVVASWLCLLLYIWTLLAPVVFPDRFGDV